MTTYISYLYIYTHIYIYIITFINPTHSNSINHHSAWSASAARQSSLQAMEHCDLALVDDFSMALKYGINNIEQDYKPCWLMIFQCETWDK